MGSGIGRRVDAFVDTVCKGVDRAAQPTVRAARGRYRQWAGASGQVRAAEEILASYGDVVAGGPFVGMRYRVPAATDLCLGPKLLGHYEAELFDVVERLCRRPWKRIVNVGSAGGYYLCGLALRCPTARSYGFEIQPALQAVARQVASDNGVAERVVVDGLCTPARLDELAGPSSLIVVDIEGGEEDLLAPDAVPNLAASTLLIELHDFVRPAISSELLVRFRATHTTEIVLAEPCDWRRHPAAAAVSRRNRRWALDEQRPAGMRWLVLEPRVVDLRSAPAMSSAGPNAAATAQP
ncbi:MAG: hypothetical protein OEY23_04930 [Acidimicrobiia bacterium]|nr:hypothetical protein [Acidimicrobiia bacterium]